MRFNGSADRAVSMFTHLRRRWMTVQEVAAAVECDRVTAAQWCSTWELRGMLRVREVFPRQYAMAKEHGGIAE